MTGTILVTGATGTLGRAVVERLPSTGAPVRGLSRTPRADGDQCCSWRTGDLRKDVGLDDAVAGVSVIVHCATTNSSGDVVATRNLVAAAERAGKPHLIYVSIVGIERIPTFYYRAKLESERLIEDSALPWTIQRATQFHSLVATLTSIQRWLPAVLMPAGVRVQPIDVGDVADRLVELAGKSAEGRAPDIGGPQVRDVTELARLTLRALGRRRAVLSVPVPGKVFRGYREGAHLVPEHADGRISFERFLAGRGAVT